ncbi:dorsal-ventral patterning tolloid-like protein 1 isoform X2 [Patella vulgata]|uniref:dorsal-ventral patterning tolloid-like protein 1 isoform X2 n=1 Tax=Patella vulgata TaxID=6465 RepID=UPI00217F7B2B|nr:dorsal-ventral patterning tolloid-like protein 1 isoform X2 [Patella vulgata]
MCRFEEQVILSGVLLILYLSPGFYTQQNDCHSTISSIHDAHKNGTFHSPQWPNPYPNNVHCTYKFIGRENERIRIKFTSFNLQGRSPICDHDYLDIFSQLKSHDEDLLEAELTGRFCGEATDNLPKLVVSGNNVLVLSFFTDSTKNYAGFCGNYEFFDASMYDIGTKAPPMACGYTIRSEARSKGYIISPTYPGMYPDNMYCYYKFQGKPGQRIKLIFTDFSLFHGDEYCPFDYLKIYDGYTNDSPVIGTFCGKYNHTVLYSTSEALHLEFVTTQGRLVFGKTPLEAEADFSFDRRGFNITYEFSDNFVNLDYIGQDAEHILGTECDQRILSKKESNGTITSPGYPESFPQNITCRYYLDGLMDRQNLEKARITFFDFNIPGNMPYCMIGYVGLNDDSRYGKGDVKEKFCGSLLPPALSSSGPRLVLTLDTHGAVRGGRFLARYNFVTDYAISGLPIAEGQCSYLYDSSKTQSGVFNSPRHPGNYPEDLDCVYIFRPQGDAKILLSFDVFSLPATDNMLCRGTDYVEFYEETDIRNNFTSIVRYCSGHFPAPFISHRVVKLLFHSDSTQSTMGFKATFQFVRDGDMNTKCGKIIPSGGSGGLIESPNFPRKYKSNTYCEWEVRASKKTNRIMLQIAYFGIEGNMATTGCVNTAVRIYQDDENLRPQVELCGNLGPENVFVSNKDIIKISFLSSPKALGGKGFKLSWTELYTADNCFGFTCAVNKLCISSSLTCNDLPNCGRDDDSDEVTECPVTAGIQILHIAIGTSISSFFCIILLICGFYHRRKFRTERPPDDHDHVEVRYVSAPSGCNTTDRLLMEENRTGSPRCQKVSMV